MLAPTAITSRSNTTGCVEMRTITLTYIAAIILVIALMWVFAGCSGRCPAGVRVENIRRAPNWVQSACRGSDGRFHDMSCCEAAEMARFENAR